MSVLDAMRALGGPWPAQVWAGRGPVQAVRGRVACGDVAGRGVWPGCVCACAHMHMHLGLCVCAFQALRHACAGVCTCVLALLTLLAVSLETGLGGRTQAAMVGKLAGWLDGQGDELQALGPAGWAGEDGTGVWGSCGSRLLPGSLHGGRLGSRRRKARAAGTATEVTSGKDSPAASLPAWTSAQPRHPRVCDSPHGSLDCGLSEARGGGGAGSQEEGRGQAGSVHRAGRWAGLEGPEEAVQEAALRMLGSVAQTPGCCFVLLGTRAALGGARLRTRGPRGRGYVVSRPLATVRSRACAAAWGSWAPGSTLWDMGGGEEGASAEPNGSQRTQGEGRGGGPCLPSPISEQSSCPSRWAGPRWTPHLQGWSLPCSQPLPPRLQLPLQGGSSWNMRCLGTPSSLSSMFLLSVRKMV